MAEDPSSLEFWDKVWSAEDVPWASKEKHTWLNKEGNLDKLLRGRQNQKIFFPLCGDAVDMKWMGDLGHTVIGVDVGRGAFEGFFKKNKIPFTSEPSAKCKGTLYKSNDGRYRLYCCDFFEFNGAEIECKCDIIFDSAALVAVHEDQRKKYAEIMLGMMTPDTLYMVEGVDFGETRSWEGPPYGLVESQLKSLFESQCEVKLLDKYIHVESGSDHHEGGEGEDHPDDEVMDCSIFTITLK